MNKKRQNVQASILDRLIDYEPEVSRESVLRRFLSVERIKATVMRDLENLLNTRGQILYAPEAYSRVNQSVYVYGLPDFTCRNLNSPYGRNQLCQDVQKAIFQFEPRLKEVTIRVQTPMRGERRIRLEIKATLLVEPINEPITFDVYLDVNRKEYKIHR